MTEYWNLSNAKNKPVTYEQFLALTGQFVESAAEAFGTPCVLDIKTMKEPLESTTFWDDRLQETLNARNEENTLLHTSDLSDVTPQKWAESRYVEVRVDPADENSAPPSAFGIVKFRGLMPQGASFTLQGDAHKAQDAMFKMMAQNESMILGDGSESNSMMSVFSQYMHPEMAEKIYAHEQAALKNAAPAYSDTPKRNRLMRLLFG